MKNKIYLFGIGLTLCILFCTNHSLFSQDIEYDILIKNAKVFDGSMKPAFRADVAIKDEVIVKVAKSINGKAKRILNADGLYVCPGFIDMHTHADEGMNNPETKACLNYLKQGVTTFILGQCGRSAWPMEEDARTQMRRWTDEGIPQNAVLLIGHGQVREIVMGIEKREPTAEELEEMKNLVKEAMEQGAYGISSGLEYVPGNYSKTDEVIELVKIVRPYNGIYHTHIRDEGDNGKLIEAIEETLQIAKQTGVPTHISHLKASGKKSWGLTQKFCAMIEEAQTNNFKITADQYPYRFGGNYPYKSFLSRSAWEGENHSGGLQSSDIDEIFDHLRDHELIELYIKTSAQPVDESLERKLKELPRKSLVRMVGGRLINLANFQGPQSERERSLLLERMKDPEEADKIRKAVLDFVDENSGPENCFVFICPDKDFEGKTLLEVAKIKDKSIADTGIELGLMDAKCITTRYCDDDVEYIMKKDWVATGSDGVVPAYGNRLLHPRSYATFLYKIKKYALEKKVISINQSIRSQTSLPADIMNLNDRGWIREGYKADIVVLDLNNVRIKASKSSPHQYSEGVKYLLINGVVVIDEDKWTGELPGKVIKLKK